MLILDTCGVSRSEENIDLGSLFFENVGTASDAPNTSRVESTVLANGFPLMMRGGQYRLCWCSNLDAQNSTCVNAAQFVVDAGELFVIGISPQDHTCALGVSCTVHIEHVDVSDGLMVLETCGVLATTELSPLSLTGAMRSLSTSSSSSTFTWSRSSALAGQYRLCWCSRDVFDDVSPSPNRTTSTLTSVCNSFTFDVGHLTLAGFEQEIHRTCISGRTCAFRGITGTGLTGREKFLVLDTCGLGHLVDGFPDAGFAENWTGNHGNHLDWGSGVLSASGGSYRLCVCVIGACELQADYRLDIGELDVLGPAKFQDRTCITGQECRIESIYGKFLSTQNSIAVLDTCGTHSLVANFPDLEVSQPASRITNAGANKVMSRGGQYRLCWCASTGNISRFSDLTGEFLSTSCGALEEFLVDVGEFTVIGPKLQHDQTCVSGQTCFIKAPTGHMIHVTDSFQLFENASAEFQTLQHYWP